jgi:CBS domain-containing protein
VPIVRDYLAKPIFQVQHKLDYLEVREMTKIKDRPEFKSKSPVMTFPPDTTVLKAVHAMSEKNYGAAVVVDGQDKPIGIVTERDFMRRLIDKQLDPAKTPLSQIMTSQLKVGRAEDTMADWVQQMSNERFRHLPIVDDDGKLINIMSQGDFVAYTWPQLLQLAKDQAIKTISSKYYLFLIAGGIGVYTLAMIFIIASMIR